MQGHFFILNPRKYRNFCLLKEAVTMEWRAFLAKPGRIQENAFWRINGSAPRHGDIFFYAFRKKAYRCDFHEHWLETPVIWGERVYS